MKHWTIFIFMTILLLLGNRGVAQTNSQTIDTIKIYKDKTGVSFRIYQHKWFSYPKYGIQSYSWNPKKMNKQDSFVIDSHPPYFFKVYDSKNRLIFEGLAADRYEGTSMIDDVKFYYKSGQLKRIEHWNDTQKDTSCSGTTIGINDGPGPEGTWKYFRKNGTVKKQIDYLIQINSCEPSDYCIIKQTTKFNKNSKTKSVRQTNLN